MFSKAFLSSGISESLPLVEELIIKQKHGMMSPSWEFYAFCVGQRHRTGSPWFSCPEGKFFRKRMQKIAFLAEWYMGSPPKSST